MMDESRWLLEGFYLRLYSPEIDRWSFFRVEQREPARYVHKWSELVASNVESGPEDLENLKPLALNRLDQVIFGVKGGCLVYLNLPHETRRWGTDKKPKATSDLRELGFIDEELSPFDEPSFVTEIFLQKGGSFEYPHLYAYNPTPRKLKPWVKFEINQMVVSEVKEVDLLDKLTRKVVPYRNITMGGVPIRRAGPG